MKQNIIILFFLTVAQIGAFTLKANAQQDHSNPAWIKTWTDTAEYKGFKSELIADETTLTYQNNNAKIECDNEEIAQKLLRRYDQLIKRAAWGYKKDRHGSYKHYIIVVSKEDANLIKEWSKTNL